MTFYAVIDTNVLVSALLSKKSDSATVRVVESVIEGKIIPLYHDDILQEYKDVLNRDKFHLRKDSIDKLIYTIKQFGIEVFPRPTGEIFVDMDDLIFYEVAMEKREDDAFLVTGNQRHYPIKDFIVTPAEMMEIIRQQS